MILAYPLVENWIAWKIGDGRQVRVGEDPWAGSGENYRLSPCLLHLLRTQRVYTLANACAGLAIRGKRMWKSA